MTIKPKPPSRTADQFVLRLPDGMRDTIAEAAKANNRSMNAEIIARLQGDTSSAPALLEAMARLNLSLAEREFDLQLAETYIDQMANALRYAYRTIKNSPIMPTSLECLDLIEDLVEVRGATKDGSEWQRGRDEKFAALRAAQKRVADVREANATTAKGSPKSEDPLPAKRASKKT